MNPLLKSHLFLLITALIAAINYSVSKLVMPVYMHPTAIIVARVFIGSVFFFTLDTIFVREKFNFRKDGLRIIGCALTGIALNQLFFYQGLNLTSASHASLLQAMIPVTVFLIAIILQREKFTWIKSSGVILGLSGVSLLIFMTEQDESGPSLTGDIYVLINSLSYGIFMVIVQPLMLKYPAITVVKWLFTIGFFMVVPFGYQEFMQVDWQHLPIEIWTAFAFIIILNTLVNYYLNTAVLRHVNPSLAGIYIYLQPVLAILIAVSLGNDHLSPMKILFSLMILAGVYLVSMNGKSKSASKSSSD